MTPIILAGLVVLLFWAVYGAVLGAYRVLRMIDLRAHQNCLTLIFWMYVIGGLPLSICSLIRGLQARRDA